jgi:ssDNA-binding Zn-finger/Zn-ribbon topoisomerase 1
MIFYGTKSSAIKTGKITNVTCPNCHNNVEMSYTVYGKYAHMYWIPFFSIGKEKIFECNHCKATYYLKDLPQQIKNKFATEQNNNPAKTPLSHFSLLFILVGFIAFAVYFGIKSDADTKVFAKSPKVGDVFYEITTSGKYSTSKIVEITKDSILVMQNQFESDKKKDVDKQSADKDKYTMPFSFSKKKYEELTLKGDTIYKIVRE